MYVDDCITGISSTVSKQLIAERALGRGVNSPFIFGFADFSHVA